MLERLRSIQHTRVGKGIVGLIMGLIMLSFVIWGIGPVFTGFNANQIASVGGESVTVEAFRQAYQTELQQLQQRLRRPVTSQQARQFGLDGQVLSRLVSDAVLDNQSRAMGLALSQDRIAKAITSDPTFAGPDGRFDRSRFAELLRMNDMNEAAFVREQRNVYLRQELVQALVGGLAAPQAAIDALHALDTETRSLDYIVLTPSAAGTVAAPDEATLQKFFDDRATSFRAPEFRKLVVLPVLPATLARPDEVSAGDVQALYDKTAGQRFTTPETRVVQQIVFPDEAEALAAAAAIKAGKSFADVAAERKLTAKDIELGSITREGAYDAAVGTAAFGLALDGVSDPVKTAFGVALIHVTGIVPVAVRPLAEVEPALRLEIASGRTGEAIRAAHDKVEDARASGQSLAEAAKAAGLQARTVDAVDAAGKDPADKPVELPQSQALLRAAFASDVGVDNDTIRTPDGGQVFFEVTAIDPARPKTFAEVRPAVEAAWRADETAKRLQVKAGDLVKALEAGRSLEEVAAENGGVPVQHANDVRRAGGSGLPRTVVAPVFDKLVGAAGTAPGEDGTRFVFKVLGTVVPTLEADSPQTKAMADRYRDALADEAVSSYLGRVQSRIGVSINPAAYAAATGGG